MGSSGVVINAANPTQKNVSYTKYVGICEGLWRTCRILC